ncbi:ArnT family glycosyltransferase [Salinarchaeum laminariae]|uniref:ArnT family glycosyltransferase n=1 Tax=Salinarchaeum laminariae TaxID=869888 RepID=UPI0020BFC49A|nr:glycosyltransferase family 39 protein [Salinarchaeum laminariae]
MHRDRIRRAVRENPWLAGVLAVAAVLLYLGIWRVEPYQFIPDEIAATTQPLTIAQEPYGMTEFKKGGNLHIWLLVVAYLVVLLPIGAYWFVTGQIDAVLAEAERVSQYTAGGQWAAANQQLLDTYHLLVTSGRFVSATAGLLTVLGVGLLARRLGGRPAGVLAPATLSVTLGFVLTAKYATEDVVVACFVIWTFLLLAYHYDTGEDRFMLYGAAATGLAISTKATAGVLVFVVAILAFRRYEPRELLTQDALRDLVRYPALAIATYVATTPSLLVRPDRYAAEIGRYFVVKSGGATFYAANEPGWIAHLGHLVTALGVPLLALSILATVGVGLLAVTDRISRFTLYPLGFAVTFFLVDSFTSSTQYNRILLIVPLLALFVGLVGGWAIDAERRPSVRRVAGPVLAIVLLLSLFYTASGAVAWSTSRGDASKWTHANIDDGEQVTLLTKPTYLPSMPDGANVTQASIDPLYDRHTAERKERVLERVRCHRTDYLVLSSFHYERYFEDPVVSPNRTAFYRSLLGGEAGYEVVAEFGPSDPNLQRDAEANFERALRLEPPSRNTNNPRIVVMQPTVPAGDGEHCGA